MYNAIESRLRSAHLKMLDQFLFFLLKIPKLVLKRKGRRLIFCGAFLLLISEAFFSNDHSKEEKILSQKPR